METPVMGSVPIRPTMILSSILTKLVMPFCSMIGRAIVIVFHMKFLFSVDLRSFNAVNLSSRASGSGNVFAAGKTAAFYYAWGFCIMQPADFKPDRGLYCSRARECCSSLLHEPEARQRKHSPSTRFRKKKVKSELRQGICYNVAVNEPLNIHSEHGGT